MAKKAGFYWHVHHDRLMEWCYDYEERLDFIKRYKPEGERELRIRLFQPVKGKLPAALMAAGAKYYAAEAEYDAARGKYDAAWAEYDAAGAKLNAARDKYDAAWAKYYAARAKYMPEIEALHKKECQNCPWDGETIFPKG